MKTKTCTICKKPAGDVEFNKNSWRCKSCDKAYKKGLSRSKNPSGERELRKGELPHAEPVRQLKKILEVDTDTELRKLLGGLSINTLTRWKTKIPALTSKLMSVIVALYEMLPEEQKEAGRQKAGEVVKK